MANQVQQDNYLDEKYDDIGLDAEESLTFSPQQLDESTFKQRNDPEQLLERFQLRLMGMYKKDVWVTLDNGEKVLKPRLFRIKNTKPRCNKKGQGELITYIEQIVNRHCVQANLDTLEEYRNRMRFISNDLAAHFSAKRTDWEIDINDIDEITVIAINLIDLFLTRALYNEERKGYGESYKENTNRDVRTPEKPNVFQKAAGYLLGYGGNKR